MLGSGDPTQYDLPLTAVLVVCAAILLAGTFTGTRWPSAVATWLRRGGLVIAISSAAVVLAATPTRSAVVGAGRLVTIWPALGLVVLFFVAWSVRAGRL